MERLLLDLYSLSKEGKNPSFEEFILRKSDKDYYLDICQKSPDSKEEKQDTYSCFRRKTDQLIESLEKIDHSLFKKISGPSSFIIKFYCKDRYIRLCFPDREDSRKIYKKIREVLTSLIIE